MDDFFNQYLSELQIESAAKTHARGFLYMHHGLMPCILEAGKSGTANRELLAFGWIRLAEVFAINKAPLRSVDCLKKSLVLSPDNIHALKFLIDQQLMMGDTTSAKAVLQTAMAKSDGAKQLLELESKLMEPSRNASSSVYQPGDIEWKMNELLASEQFATVINMAMESDLQDLVMLKKLACAFGAVGHNANYRQTWNKILILHPDTLLDDCDRFYQPIEFQAS